MSREPIRKSVRFEVFKRDSFTCQYCGQKSPDVVLEIDHITPVADGGTNDILNLVTACRPCNAGKSDRKLSDASAIERRRTQLEDLEERRQQLEMLHQWHMSLVDLNDQAVDMAQSLWFESIGNQGHIWTASARDEIRKLIKRDGFDAVCGAIRDAADGALRSARIESEKDDVTNEWFWKIGRILSVKKADAKDPGVARLFYIRGILRNRCRYLNERACISLLEDAKAVGISIDWLEWVSKRVTSWTQFRQQVIDEINALDVNDEEATDGSDS
jgi:hypothetical protein